MADACLLPSTCMHEHSCVAVIVLVTTLRVVTLAVLDARVAMASSVFYLGLRELAWQSPKQEWAWIDASITHSPVSQTHWVLKRTTPEVDCQPTSHSALRIASHSLPLTNHHLL
eukprot:scaffold71979_cov17-Tisochrysis_lutea.AAC.1